MWCLCRVTFPFRYLKVLRGPEVFRWSGCWTSVQWKTARGNWVPVFYCIVSSEYLGAFEMSLFTCQAFYISAIWFKWVWNLQPLFFILCPVMPILGCSLHALAVLTTKVNTGFLDKRWKKEIEDMGAPNSGLGFGYLKSVSISDL